MEEIHIPRLLSLPNRTEKLTFNGRLPDLDTLTPVRGMMDVTHCRTYLEVRAQAETIVTLTCDRTLQQYNHRLSVDTSEIIWLSAAAVETDSSAKEVELSLDDLTESLPPNGYFDPQGWLYEQLCLALPLRQVSEESLGVDCNYTDTTADGTAAVDARWSALETLKDRLATSD
ncbi:MAG: YceD family protein [Cyanobacteria bacterium J06641_5]